MNKGIERGQSFLDEMAAQRAMASVVDITKAEGKADPKRSPAAGPARTVELLRGSDVIPEAVLWIWTGWLAAGKLHVLGGAPGTGKTNIAMALAATMTIGGCWPDHAIHHWQRCDLERRG